MIRFSKTSNPMRNTLLIFAIILCAFTAKAQEISLNGKWSFAIDPANVGELNDWHLPWALAKNDKSLLVPGWDRVTVPHSWSLDPRYNIVGKAWYRKGFKLPADATNSSVRLKFEAVYYKCRIFLNGDLVGMREGGYTPFTIDITKKVKYPEVNFLVVEADNSWNQLTIPGAGIGKNPKHQLFPWLEFGGITRDVTLQISPKIYISKQKIESVPDLKTGTSRIRIITWIENRTYEDADITLQPAITSRTNQKLVRSGDQLSKTIKVKAWTQEKVVMEDTLSAPDTLLWDFDNPNLYDVESSLAVGGKAMGSHKTYFGIREFKQKGIQLLLNGKPIRLAGGNRHSDHPKYGSTEPAELATLDMGLQRNGNMVMARLCHTPTSKHFFRWADENGSLIIAEIPIWQTPPETLANARFKEDFRLQMTEMVEAFWNSPSIIAWSTGNEYSSWTPEGDEWTRYQAENYRELDTTRLITYAGHKPSSFPENLSVPHDSFRHLDFICINLYNTLPEFETSIKNIHQKYPDKPVFITEFGLRLDRVKNEQERIDHLKGVIDIARRNPYVCGMAYWSFNDYRSRYPDTDPNGYREWGIVDANRKPRGLYTAFQKDLSPVTVAYDNSSIKISARADFPSYTLKNYKLVLVSDNKTVEEYPLPELNPGESTTIKTAKPSVSTTIAIQNSSGFRVYDSSVN
jgi:beta-glucuronidase